MTKSDLPPFHVSASQVEVVIGSWCETFGGLPTSVVMVVGREGSPLLFKMDSPQKVDELIAMLEKQKKEVWPYV